MSEYRSTALANGLRVVSVPMPHHYSAEILLYVGVGGRHEIKARAGASHFLEHMLFKGTVDYPSGPELERAFEAIGGSANAATDSETTCYHTRVHPQCIDEGIALFASMLQRPLFNDIETERRVILEEAMGDLNESGRQINADNIVAGLVFPDHPLGRPTVGSLGSIRRISSGQLHRHHAEFYTPRNTVLAVAGPVEHAPLVAAAQRAFGAWQGAAAPPAQLFSAAAGATALRWVRDAGSQAGLQLAFQLPGRASEHAVNLRVLRRLLGWGGMSRLMLRLREELGLTYAVDASLALYADAGVLAIDLAVTTDNLAPATTAILELLSELHRNEVSPEELAHCLHCYRCDIEFSRDQVDEMALRYAWAELTGDRRTIAADLADLDRVDAAGLRRTVHTLFAPERLRGAVVGPYRSRERKEVESVIGSWRP
jgi:predicted Zn-dependent peptidase